MGIIGAGKYNNLGLGLKDGKGSGCFILNESLCWSYHGNKNGHGFGYGDGDVNGHGNGMAIGKKNGMGRGVEHNHGAHRT